MGRYKDLVYSVSYPMPKKTVRKDGGGNPYAAAAEALNWGVSKVFDIRVDSQVDKKLDELYPDIHKAMVGYNGVLVIIQYQQWEMKNEAGNRPLFFLNMYVGPAASNRQSAFRKYKMKERVPTIKQAPREGMVYGTKAFVWFSRLPSHERAKNLRTDKQEKDYWKPAP